MIPRIEISKGSARKCLLFQRLLTKSVEAIDMTNPTKNIHATRFGIGLLTTTSSAIIVPAISMIIIPAFVVFLSELFQDSFKTSTSV